MDAERAGARLTACRIRLVRLKRGVVKDRREGRGRRKADGVVVGAKIRCDQADSFTTFVTSAVPFFPLSAC